MEGDPIPQRTDIVWQVSMALCTESRESSRNDAGKREERKQWAADRFKVRSTASESCLEGERGENQAASYISPYGLVAVRAQVSRQIQIPFLPRLSTEPTGKALLLQLYAQDQGVELSLANARRDHVTGDKYGCQKVVILGSKVAATVL